MRIAIIDAQGAGLGQAIIKKLNKEIDKNFIEIIALGTNLTATNNMIKIGATKGFTGETQICTFFNKNSVDCIIGPIGILSADGIKGEITPEISKVIFNTNCTKYILPLKKHGIYIPGTRNLEIKDIINEIVSDISFKIDKS